MSVGSGLSRSRSAACCLSLYGSPDGEHPALEIRVKRMCRTPPYNRAETRRRLIADLCALGIPRLDAEADLAGKRPNIPLDELSGGRAGHLLAFVDHWIDNIRMHATEPETTNETRARTKAEPGK